MYIKELDIGNVKLKNNIFLAPMAGVTDLPFRIICQDFGMGLQYTEMASAKAIYYNDRNTEKLLDITNQNVPVAVQLFGSEPGIIAKAIIKIKNGFPIIDLNMGCPAPKVTKNGEGSSLLKDLDRVYEIVKEAVEASETVPVTVKIRTGWDRDNIVAIEVAKAAEQAGASGITVHGRTRNEFFTRQGRLGYN